VLQRSFLRIGNWRLASVVIAVVLGWLAFGRDALSGWWLLAPGVVFAGLFIWHQRVIHARTVAERAMRYYDAGLGRLRHEWQGRGQSGERFRDGGHVYSEDLDVFGKGSLFELLCTCRTAAGEDTLAAWLLHAAPEELACGRQGAVNELRGNLDLREDVALLGEDVSARVHAALLTEWGKRPAVRFARGLRPAALGLAIVSVLCLVGFFTSVLPLWPFLLVLGSQLVFAFLIRKQVGRVVGAVDTPAQDLQILALLIERLEQETFSTPALRQLRAQLQAQGEPASKRIKKLSRWMEWLDSGDHLLVRLLGLVLLWREQLAIAIEMWRRETGPSIGLWIETTGEFEALASLACLAFEHPEWTIPELAAGGTPRFEAEGLRHPLLAFDKCVPNEIALSGDTRLLIVSGSNMSGKSTLLRSIGLNTVLAWAGAPVAARRLCLTPLQTGASLRAIDSLQDNRSRFLAEITRLREIVELTKNGSPVLFLLDELLSGTNSHDRRIGAAGLIRGLLDRAAIGLMTTHDLALAQIEQDVGPLAANVHFEDQMRDGRMEFDYRLKPGVVTHSNALELMRAVGLPV
jgi:hypothetical protein